MKTSASLRRNAEEKLRTELERLQKLSARDIQELVHELATHQIELEMQNEELRKNLDELESSRSQYAELYDFAPVGYFTLDMNGVIEGVNLTGAQLLGIERGLLLKKTFNSFIVDAADRETFFNHRKEVFQKRGNRTCEIKLKRKDDAVFFAQLQSVANEFICGKTGHIRTTIIDVTDRRQAEEALRHSETRFREIADFLPQPIYETDPNGAITFTNRAGFEHFGYTPGDLARGLSVKDMIVPAEQELAFGNMAAILQGRPGRADDYTALRKDGTTFPVIITSAPIMRDGRPVGLRGVILDITGRVRAEEHLRRSELKFRQLAETIHEVFWICDIASKDVLYVSPAYQEIFGRTCQSFYGQAGPFLESLHPGDAAGMQAAMARQEKGVPLDEEFRIVRPDRSVRWIRARTFFVMNEKGENSRIIGVAEDITDRKNAEGLLRTHAGQLQALSSRLIEARESERRFIARELHDEIGQQLTGLKLSLDMMQSSPSGVTGEQLHGLQVLAGELLERVRNLSLDLRPSMLDDLGLLPALTWHFNRYREQTGIRVVFNHSGMGKRFDAGIETVTYRVIQEALTNAARYAAVVDVAVSLIADDRAIHIAVTDEGKGFDPAEVLVRRQTMGLFGMRERVEAAGGDLMVTSAPGAGTLLIASIPQSPEDAAEGATLYDDHRTG